MCSTPFCAGHEVHCKDCGRFISSCLCGASDGESGWPYLRWKRYQQAKMLKFLEKARGKEDA